MDSFYIEMLSFHQFIIFDEVIKLPFVGLKIRPARAVNENLKKEK
jgi:hypothetical protein